MIDRELPEQYIHEFGLLIISEHWFLFRQNLLAGKVVVNLPSPIDMI